MAYRFVCFGKNVKNLSISIENGLVGFKSSAALTQVGKGDILFLYVNSGIVAVATVESDGFESHENLWPDKTYPYRFRIMISEKISSPQNFLISPARKLLYEAFGSGWGYKFMYSPRPIPGEIADQILRDIGFNLASRLNEQQG